jgi:hypothetical protein
MSRSWINPGVAYLTRSLLSVIFPTASSSNVWLLYKPFESPHGLFQCSFWVLRLWGLQLMFSWMGCCSDERPLDSVPGLFLVSGDNRGLKSGQDSEHSSKVREQISWHNFRFIYFMFILYFCPRTTYAGRDQETWTDCEFRKMTSWPRNPST